MKKLTIKLVLLCLLLTCSLGFSACNKKQGDEGSIESEKGKKVSIMIPGHNSTKEDLWQNKTVKEFTEKYPDVTVEFVTASWENWKTKVYSAANGGEPIDLINDSANNNPMFALQGITQPLQKYINMENPNLHKQTMDSVFKYGSDYYVAVPYPNVCAIYYNKDMLSSEGIQDLGEIYKSGEWTFDKFVSIAKSLTYDNKSGKRWGFSTNYPYVFFGANATSALKLNGDFKYELNLNDANLKTSLELIQDGWFTSKWQGWETDPWTTFYNGKSAMIADFQFFEKQLMEVKEYGLCDFDYGVVPMPVGPNNKNGVSPVAVAGWAVGNGADAPYHAGKLIDMLIDADLKDQAEVNKLVPKQNVELYKKLATKPFCTNSYDSAVDGAFDIFDKITQGSSITQVIAEFTPIYNQKIEQANKSLN